MEWVLRIMANLLRPDELGPAEAAYKVVAALVAVMPDPSPAGLGTPARVATTPGTRRELGGEVSREVASARPGRTDDEGERAVAQYLPILIDDRAGRRCSSLLSFVASQLLAPQAPDAGEDRRRTSAGIVPSTSRPSASR